MNDLQKIMNADKIILENQKIIMLALNILLAPLETEAEMTGTADAVVVAKGVRITRETLKTQINNTNLYLK